MSQSGHILFLPWVTLPAPITIGEFQFAPLDRRNPAVVVGYDVANTVTEVLSRFVDIGGKPIGSCTVVLKADNSEPWNIPDVLRPQARRTAEILALASLSEQRFFEWTFRPHLNAAMFQVIGQGIEVGSDRISLFYPRRGSALRIGGLRFKDVLFQRPSQVEGTACETINVRLANALDRICKENGLLWQPISSSLELFLLGHAETPELGWDTCIMLSAMAFERLLKPSLRSAKGTAEAFARLWAPYAGRTMAEAKRVKLDDQADYAAEQQAWPVHRKWMKELYELRSSAAHHGTTSGFSRNWNEAQHMVIAAFVYPLVIKLHLRAAGFDELTDEEVGACEALDDLLEYRTESRLPNTHDVRPRFGSPRVH